MKPDRLEIVAPMTVDGSCLNNGRPNAAAGAGIYWGMNHEWNEGVRVPDKQTNNRGEVYAILRALHRAQPTQSLQILSDSEYAMEAITIRAPEDASLGWKCTNGDMLRAITELIKRRSAPVTFIQVKGHSNNAHNDAADALAKLGAQKPRVASFASEWNLDTNHWRRFEVAEPLRDDMGLNHPPKVSYKPLPKSAKEPNEQFLMNEHTGALTAHRGRKKLLDLQMQNRKQLLDVRTERDFWRFAKELMSPSPPRSAFTAEDLKQSFWKRMNPVVPTPLTFDTARLEFNKALASAIPEHTEDETAEAFFSAQFTEEDMAEAKDHLRSHPPTSARGYDQKSYADVCDLENDVLCDLVNRCIQGTDAPSIWLITVLIGALKRGKPKDNPDNWRTLGLESCFLKLTTLLIHMRLTKWSIKVGMLPPSQNGFREGYHTNDNVFILRCAVDRARAMGRTLYVIFADLSNAFPSTDQSTLWLKMRAAGAGGPIFDWLRMLYKRMVYIVRHESEMSTLFRALIGILIGDTSSPILWTLYLSDFKPPSDETLDMLLAGVIITNLEQADDVALLALDRERCQENMNALWKWCHVNFMVINAIKSQALVLGPIPRNLTPFRFGEDVVHFVKQAKYVGFNLNSTKRNIFEDHYKIKASKGRAAAQTLLGLESVVGSLPVWEARKMYVALVDPHLTHGCEISLDVDPGLLEVLEDVQHGFWRRVLGLNKRSVLAPLYTETGLEPLRFRRLKLALAHLRYLIGLRDTERYVAAAGSDTVALCTEGKASWAMDLRYVIQHLPFRVALPNLATISLDEVDTVIKSVDAGVRTYLQHMIDNPDAPKLYLLRGRLEPQKDSAPIQKTMQFRHYLNVVNPDHRIALTRLLLSSHCLAVERLRWIDPRRERIDPEMRVCRFCRNKVETPEHALIECMEEPGVVSLRAEFLRRMYAEVPNLPEMSAMTTTEFLKRVIYYRQTISLVAKFAYEVVKIYQATPMYIPPRPVHWMIQPAQITD